MRLTGVLRSWNDDRGFGFIAPSHGGTDIFVHISAFPRDGSRPTVGETVTYELGRGKNGQAQAASVLRQALESRPRKQVVPKSAPVRRRSFMARFAGVVLLGALGVFGYSHYQGRLSSNSSQPQGLSAAPATVATPPVPNAGFSCDGRTHCSQMGSCSEAKYFLQHCPGTQMDGNNDGVPCQQQWCTSSLAR